jgi:hypothetical protein
MGANCQDTSSVGDGGIYLSSGVVVVTAASEI